MNKKLYITGVLILALSMLTIPAAAQAETPTSAPVAQTPNGNEVLFSDLQETNIILTGPYDTYTSLFGLPADWQLTGSANLDLMMTVAFNTDTGAATSTEDAFRSLGGIMIVRFNRVVIATLQLNQQGNVVQNLVIPQSALVSQRSDGRMEVDFTLDSGLTCQVNQQMNVIVHSNSLFTFPHAIVIPDTSLVNFPRPLYQDSIIPDQAIVVVADNPSAAELQSALTVASGLGNLTSSNLAMTLSTASSITAEQKAASNLILVGNAATLPFLNELKLSTPVQDGNYQISGTNVDDGVIQMVNSPWSASYVVLVVSGNTDKGTVKAAQAVSTGVLRPYDQPDISVIGDINDTKTQSVALVDQTFSDLGYSMNVLTRDGVSTATYKFYLPPGQALSEDAYIDLIYGHSALLNYDRSGVVMELNGHPIGSIRFGDDSAAQSNNHLKVMIPASSVLPGMNRLDVRATLTMRDICINPTSNGQWFAIWPESQLYLPVNLSPVEPSLLLGLGSYPEPFVLDPNLSSTAFVLQQDSPETWASALQIAAYLGDRANGSMTSLSVFYGDITDTNTLSNYDLLMIGRPSQMPIMKEINANLPAPFAGDSEVASENAMMVDYRIPENASIGYVQFLSSPWNANHIILAALGNTTQGVDWASTSLIDSQLRSRLAGNFAAVSGQQIITADTRVAPVIDSSNTVGEVSVVPVVTKIDLSEQPAARPAWILPTFIVVAALVVLLIIGAFVAGKKNRV